MSASMNANRVLRAVAVGGIVVAVVACGRRKDVPATGGPGGATGSSTAAPATAGSGATLTSGTISSGAATTSGASDGCVACRAANCGAEVRACEGDPVCARNMGCKEECKGDKSCMGKCVRPTSKFSALGRCLVTRCKAECLSP